MSYRNYRKQTSFRNARPVDTAGRIEITGNTYPVREALKALGAKWDGTRKAWLVPEDKADEARALVAGAPAKGKRIPDSGLSWRGGRAVRSNGMCEDAPCCGCCGPQGDGGSYYGDY